MSSESKEQQELINTGLGLTTIGIGATFALFPGLANRLGGFDVEKGPGRNALFRIIGMRDLAFGVGILLNLNEAKNLRLWLNLLALIAGSDILVLGLALPRSKHKLNVLVGVLMSAVVTALALRNSRE